MGFVCSSCCKSGGSSGPVAGTDPGEDVMYLSTNGGYGVEYLRAVPKLRFEGRELGCGLFQSLRVCKALVFLQMVNCTGVCNFRLLSQLKTLQALCLEGDIKFLNMASVLSLPKLKVLSVENNSIVNDEILPDFGSMEKLETLDISGCSLVTSVKGFQNLSALYGVNFSNTSVTDDTIKQLAACPALGVVQLLNCKGLTDVSPLESVATLEVLDISGCKGVKAFGNIWQNPKLLQLGLANCAITDDVVKEISASTTLKSITLSMCKQITDVSPLKSVTTLDTLLLDFCIGVKDVGFVGALPKLAVLSVAGTSVNDEGVKSIGESRSLIKIFFTSCARITDVSPLEAIATLEEVSVYGCNEVNNISCLSAMPSLKVFYAENSVLTDVFIDEFLKNRTHVKIVQLFRGGKSALKDIIGLGALSELALVLSDEPTLY